MSPPRSPRAAPGTPLYVHLPFCAAKCHYCDFYSVAAEGHDRDAMVAAILREAELRAPHAPRTVFLGGGTPSLLEEREVAALLDGLDALTGFRASAGEVTAECNPESLDLAKARALLALGVRRLSIGFQSLDDATLALFGRVHSAADSFAAFAAAREAGCRDLNVDLIYASPGQSLGGWERDLARVLDLAPDHLSAYHLTYEEATPFRSWLEEGRLARHPEELELAFFEATRGALDARGYEPYEISNFALPGHRCDHNVNYWRNGEYVGLGPSAASLVAGERSGNVRSVGGYLRRIAEQGEAGAWREQLPPLARLGETWWLGLRLAEGLSPAEARARARYREEGDPLLAVAERALAEGVLARDGERYRLSPRGLPLADWVARRFLAAG